MINQLVKPLIKNNTTESREPKEESNKMTANEQHMAAELVSCYGRNPKSLEGMNEKELEAMLEECKDGADLFPNDDQYDGSHEYD